MKKGYVFPVFNRSSRKLLILHSGVDLYAGGRGLYTKDGSTSFPILVFNKFDVIHNACI